MVKAVIKFDLDVIEDQLYMDRCMKSLDMACMLFEIRNNLRKKCETELEALEADSDKWDGMEVCLRQINNLFEQFEINTDTLVQ